MKRLGQIWIGLSLVACHGGGSSGGGGAPDGSSGSPDGSPGTVDAAPDRPDAAPSAGIEACGDLALTGAFTSMPAPDGVGYLRCETAGTESGGGAAWSPDGSHLAIATTAGTVRLFQTAPWLELAQLTAPIGAIDAYAFSPDGARLATFSAEMGELTLWRAGDAVAVASFQTAPASMVDTTTARLAFSPDGNRIAVSSNGAIVDLTTGAVTPAFLGATAYRLEWVGDDRLFVDERYAIGNSPPSAALVLHDVATGADLTLFQAYDRALLGYALSPDRSLVVFVTTDEEEPAGLHVFRTSNGDEIHSDPSFTGTVLDFSHDGARLFTVAGSTVSVLDTQDFQVASSFAVPTAGAFEIQAVAPDDAHLVIDWDGVAHWVRTDTGAVDRSLPSWLDVPRWTADGQYGAAGGPGGFFFVWREAAAELLCRPPVRETAPPSGELVTVPYEGSVTSSDGSITATDVFDVHTHAQNYYQLHVTDNTTGHEVRVFGSSGNRTSWLSQPDGARIYTQVGSPIAKWGWCR